MRCISRIRQASHNRMKLIRKPLLLYYWLFLFRRMSACRIHWHQTHEHSPCLHRVRILFLFYSSCYGIWLSSFSCAIRQRWIWSNWIICHRFEIAHTVAPYIHIMFCILYACLLSVLYIHVISRIEWNWVGVVVGLVSGPLVLHITNTNPHGIISVGCSNVQRALLTPSVLYNCAL